MISFDSCWEWPGTRRKDDDRAVSGHQYAYRLVYEAATGEPCPAGVAHHRCENPGCVNPTHLEFIDQGEHITGHGLPGDWGQADKTHCPHGHPYAGGNLYEWRGMRYCRECRKARGREYRARRKAES